MTRIFDLITYISIKYWQFSHYFPICQVRVARFYVRCAAPCTNFPSSSFFLPPSSLSRPSSSFLLAGSHLPALDRSGPRRTSSASSWSQGASPDLICQLLIAMVLAGLQQARIWALWTSPDFNRPNSKHC